MNARVVFHVTHWVDMFVNDWVRWRFNMMVMMIVMILRVLRMYTECRSKSHWMMIVSSPLFFEDLTLSVLLYWMSEMWTQVTFHLSHHVMMVMWSFMMMFVNMVFIY